MASNPELENVFSQMIDRFRPDKAQGVDTLIQFDLTGDDGGAFWVKVADGACTSGTGLVENPRITIKSSAATWLEIASGKANVINSFMMGKLKVSGDMGLAIKIQSMFGL
ncbi:MAG: SCP2 sterol-binding domain-containing protein [Anaerolineae bacterium]|jgi:putative sterol carrier protein|nr:SCP2 sterol-binding domain-containing protein [Anaerolineae bacterium]